MVLQDFVFHRYGLFQMKQTQKYTVLCSGRGLTYPFKVMAANTIKVLFHNIYKVIDPDSKGTTLLY